jgi:hypothetical protein
MAGLVPAIHVLLATERKTWMPGIKPGMTRHVERIMLLTIAVTMLECR